MRRGFLWIAAVLAGAALLAGSAPRPARSSTEPTDGPPGRQTYMHYCASCHGIDAKGGGPAASALKTPPTDLTRLAKGNGGKFPQEYVAGVVRFGKPISAHGSADMPVWGPIFSMVDFNEVAIRKRIHNLCDYLASLQEK
ncbi:MAG TPA: cytochrome c [Candidatus Acidoferrum sp.]|nr:cytochrome c [Candidatus Acidoferrum sp.]